MYYFPVRFANYALFEKCTMFIEYRVRYRRILPVTFHVAVCYID